MEQEPIKEACLVFPYSRVNANAISALVASLDIYPIFKDLDVKFPPLKKIPESLKRDLEPYNKIILAFSVFSTQLGMISRLIEEYRELLVDKELLVIAGGPHPTGDPFSMLYNGADVVCIGEGEVVIRDLVEHHVFGKDLSEISSIAYLNGDNQMIRTQRAAPLDLSQFPPFSKKHKLIRPIEITRGCAWKCRFCQIRSKGGVPVRHRPISQIVEYVQFTKTYFSRRRPDIRFISPNALSYGSDDGIKLNLDVLEEMLQGVRDVIGNKGHIYFGSFPSEVRPETLTQESVSLLAKFSDAKTIVIGGQSGSDTLLQSTDRGHDVGETERATKLLLNVGFQVDVDIIFGLPGETDKDIEDTIEHMQRLVDLGARIHSHTFLPLVGTPLANADPGKIHPKYQKIIHQLQQGRKLSGQHVKQQREAEILAQRRTIELDVRQSVKTVKPENDSH